ncbi:MAG: glycerophosphodiester phosphodiesterase [Deltaproteobacteria bacterium]|nr:glycerophosphodiester phosphodiesterase [Deltaproteobacteria bacterium]
MVSRLRFRLLKFCLATLFGVSVFGCSEGKPEIQPPENIFSGDWFLNIAHRGGRDLAPEATLVAYHNAADIGVDVLEMDLHSTADGIIVCMHDIKIDRTTDGSGYIHDYTFEELSQFDAAYNFSSPSFPYRGQGITVPKFEEVLDTFPDHYFIAEIKQVDPSIIDDVLAIIEQRDLLDRIILSSQTDSVLVDIRAKNSAALTSFGAAEMITFVSMTNEDEENFQPSTKFVQPPSEVVSEEFMARLRRFDLKVHAWTVNDLDEMKRLINIGADGIMTDDPETLENLIDELGLHSGS